jgi:hypothetical protein
MDYGDYDLWVSENSSEFCDWSEKTSETAWLGDVH